MFIFSEDEPRASLKHTRRCNKKSIHRSRCIMGCFFIWWWK